MKETINNLKFVWKYAKKEKKRLILYVFLELISFIINIIMPILSAQIIVNLTSNSYYQLAMIAIVIFLINCFSNFGNFIAKRTYQRSFRSILIDIQTDIGKEILSLDNKTLENNGSGVFIQRISNDGMKLSEAIGWLTTLLTDILKNIGVFIAIYVVNMYFFLFELLTFIVIKIINHHRIKIQKNIDKKIRETQEKSISFVGETVRGARDIKMLNSEENFVNKIKNFIIDVNQTKYDWSDNNRRHMSLTRFSNNLCDLCEILLLIILIKYNGLAVASAIVLFNYSNKTRGFSNILDNFTNFLQEFNLSALRVREIMNSEKFTKETFGTKHLKGVKGNFEFKNVIFSYGKNNVLNDLSFKVNANETVAFVGKSGVGKTTIFSLLCKMYDGYEGKITIDGVDIQELDKDSIRGNITIVSQDPYIFNLSIKDNLKLVCKNLTDKQMKEACKMACLDEFIESLPDKYDTIVGEGGVTLSGGQKQRLAIARAFVQKTEIILFDEATSALDNETQHEIAKAIDNLKKDYTILIIAHRLSTIKNANRILFIEDGKVKKEGTHEELLTTCKSYKELYESEIEK